jgi:hypothetical protein
VYQFALSRLAISVKSLYPSETLYPIDTLSSRVIFTALDPIFTGLDETVMVRATLSLAAARGL